MTAQRDELGVFSRISVCHHCGAFVLNEEQHTAYHDAVLRGFEERDEQLRRVVDKVKGKR